MKKIFQCWNCLKEYNLSLEISNQEKIVVSCPYCNTDGVVDLQPYRKKPIPVMRHVDLHVKDYHKKTEEEIQLPDILPTSKPD